MASSSNFNNQIISSRQHCYMMEGATSINFEKLVCNISTQYSLLYASSHELEQEVLDIIDGVQSISGRVEQCFSSYLLYSH